MLKNSVAFFSLPEVLKNIYIYIQFLLNSLKGSPVDNISTLLKKKWNPICKSEDVQTLQLKQTLYAS